MRDTTFILFALLIILICGLAVPSYREGVTSITPDNLCPPSNHKHRKNLVINENTKYCCLDNSYNNNCSKI